MSETSDVLDKRFRGTCRTLFKQELGSLEECAPWLLDGLAPITHNKSSLSGKEVVCAPTDYCKKARYLSFDEVDFNKKFEPLSINEIKDIDSLLASISERTYYSGNIYFGNSGHIEKSSNVNDSFYIYETGRYGNSKYIAYCRFGRQSEDCFGSEMKGECSMCIKCNRDYRCKRCFEVWMSQNSSDCYYSYGLDGCSDCIFCFNAASRRHAIGNLALEPAKYNALKAKLLEEMMQEFKKHKKLPSFMEIVKKSKAHPPKLDVPSPKTQDRQDKSKIETAFSHTTGLLFGKKLEGIDNYKEWLRRHTRSNEKVSSAISGRELYLPHFAKYPMLPRERLLGMDEAKVFGEAVRLDPSEIDSLSLSNAHEKLGKLAYFCIEVREGQTSNIMEGDIAVDSSHCYRSTAVVYSKCMGYTFWPRTCENLFGCDSPFDSAFSINCYSCTQLTRCFEIDCCGYCSDSYFCHNGENLHDCMFCFNVKNRKNCIGNSQFSPQDYAKVKSLLLSQISDELIKKKDLKWDIYNVGCQKV